MVYIFYVDQWIFKELNHSGKSFFKTNDPAQACVCKTKKSFMRQ